MSKSFKYLGWSGWVCLGAPHLDVMLHCWATHCCFHGVAGELGAGHDEYGGAYGEGESDGDCCCQVQRSDCCCYCWE